MILTPKILARLVAIVRARRPPAALLLLAGGALPHQPRRAAGAGRLARPARRHDDRGGDRLLGRLPARLPADRPARRRLAGPAQHRLPGRPLPRALRDPQPAGPAAALHGAHPLRRARLRRGRADARGPDRHQLAGHPRHAAQERLRLLPRLADLPRPEAPPAPGAGRGGRGPARGRGRRCWEPRHRVPASRRPPPLRQPHGAADRRARRLRRRPLRGALLPALGPAGPRRPAVPGGGEEQPHPRVQGDRPARRHPRPQRRGPGRKPHQPGAAAQHAEAARRPGPAADGADPARAPRAHVAAQGAADDPRTGRSRRRGADNAAPRRRLRPHLLPGREPAPLPRRGGPARVRPRLPGRQPRRARPRQRRRGQRRRAEGTAVQGPRTGRRGRQGRGRVHLRQVPAGEPGPDQDPGQRARPADARRAAGLPAADSRRQPQALDRLRSPGGGGKRAGLPRPARGVRDDERRQRPDPRPRLLPHLRPLRLHPPDEPGAGQRALPRPGGGAAGRPGDPGAVPDGLDLQAHHRHGGARRRRDHAAGQRSSTTARSPSATSDSRTPAAPPTARSTWSTPCASPPTSTSTSSG